MDTERSKILVSVWTPIIDVLNKKVKAACLRRDEFLDHVLRHEANMLTQEVGTSNSDEAKAYIAKHLGMLHRRQLNLNLSVATVQAIGNACERINVPRDAFINRVLLFLVAGKSFFQRLLVDIDWEWAEQRVIEDYYDFFNPALDGALPAVEDTVRSDPFRFYRACIEVTKDAGDAAEALHQAFLPRGFLKGKRGPESAIGFNCYVPDFQIEGHPAQRDAFGDLEELLRDLGERADTVQRESK